MSCRIAKITQISTGQAGDHVNRDLENLFKMVNALVECTQDVISGVQGVGNSLSQGSGSGGGSGGGGTSGGSTTGPPNPGFPNILETGSSVTLGNGISGVIYIDPSADINVTLGEPGHFPLTIVHYGSGDFDMTVKNLNGDTLGVIGQYQYSTIPTMVNSSGVWGWPTGLIVVGSQGSLYLAGSLVATADTVGIQLKDSAGHWWEALINTSGAIVTTDTGTTKPPAEEPIL